MSLDVYLTGPERDEPCTCTRCGHSHTRKESDEFFSGNVTHNLARMATAAGLYDCCWRPDEHGLTTAQQLIEPLRTGLAKLEADAEHYKFYNPANGWGSVEGLTRFVRDYLAACEAHPDANVRASR